MPDILKTIEQLEKGLKASQDLRQTALTRKEMHLVGLKEAEEELRKLGVTSEDGEKELAAIDKEIAEKIKEAESYIPFDLLREYKLL